MFFSYTDRLLVCAAEPEVIKGIQSRW